MYARCVCIVSAMDQIMENKGYHCHSKMTMKDRGIGGA